MGVQSSMFLILDHVPMPAVHPSHLFFSRPCTHDGVQPITHLYFIRPCPHDRGPPICIHKLFWIMYLWWRSCHQMTSRTCTHHGGPTMVCWNHVPHPVEMTCSHQHFWLPPSPYFRPDQGWIASFTPSWLKSPICLRLLMLIPQSPYFHPSTVPRLNPPLSSIFLLAPIPLWDVPNPCNHFPVITF